MKRVALVTLLVLVAWAGAARAAEIESLVLCPAADLGNKDCRAGEALQGEGIRIDHRTVHRIFVLSALSSDKPDLITHVWVFNGRRQPQEPPTLYRGDRRTFVAGAARVLDELSGRKDVSWVSAAAAIVRLLIEPSPYYRTRSSKILNARWVGSWRVLIFDGSASNRPLGEIDFKVY